MGGGGFVKNENLSSKLIIERYRDGERIKEN
jgi:hypothetical protein